MTINDIKNEIEWYENRLIQDPEGKSLYKAMLDALKSELKKRESKKK